MMPTIFLTAASLTKADNAKADFDQAVKLKPDYASKIEKEPEPTDDEIAALDDSDGGVSEEEDTTPEEE
jgi:hypothetical protein